MDHITNKRKLSPGGGCAEKRSRLIHETKEYLLPSPFIFRMGVICSNGEYRLRRLIVRGFVLYRADIEYTDVIHRLAHLSSTPTYFEHSQVSSDVILSTLADIVYGVERLVDDDDDEKIRFYYDFDFDSDQRDGDGDGTTIIVEIA